LKDHRRGSERSKVQVIGVSTVREKDGLALSSRNVYLSPTERVATPVLYRTLKDSAAPNRSGRANRGHEQGMAREGKLSRCRLLNAACTFPENREFSEFAADFPCSASVPR
jgi:hypothetical protein